MTSAPRGGLVSRDGYLATEACAETKSEYVAGEIRAMAGASPEHVRICFNLAAENRNQTRGTACRGSGSDQRVWIEACDRYYYPNLSITCGAQQFETRQRLRSLINPAVIVEVLSPATEEIDRNEKLACYQRLESLAACVFTLQDAPRIEVLRRDRAGAWVLEVATGLSAEIAIPVANCTLRLSDIYEDVEFSCS